nr:hypothetical protein [Gemmatimonadota bacterium]
MSASPTRREIERIASAALAEDGRLDITSALTIPPRIQAGAIIEYRSGGVVSGLAYADEVARSCGCRIEWSSSEGGAARTGATLGVVRGDLA